MKLSQHVFIDPQHPAAAALKAVATGENAVVSIVDCHQWPAAWQASTADLLWVVDRRAACDADEFQTALRSIPTPLTSVTVTPWNAECASRWNLWNQGLPVVATLWNDPARDLAVCVPREKLGELPSLTPSESTLHAWLIEVVLRPDSIQFIPHPQTPSGPRKVLQDFPRLPPLVPRSIAVGYEWLVQRIHQLKPRQLVPDAKSLADAVAVKAGLLQWYDALDLSHQLAQSIEGLGVRKSGDYWHAIMHRREPDHQNAEYWFRRVGAHVVFDTLVIAATRPPARPDAPVPGIPELIDNGRWSTWAFSHQCVLASHAEDSSISMGLRQLQAIEMTRLMEETCADALGVSFPNETYMK